MQEDDDERPADEYRDFFSSGFGPWIALLAVIGIGAALWLLPRLYVDEGAYVIDADQGTFNRAAIESAYNSARVPIGVVLAALTAGTAAILGVRATLKSLKTTENSLRDARQRHKRDLQAAEKRAEEVSARHERDLVEAGARALEVERRWIAETRSKRYMEACEQLGHDKGAVRLAGVYAMARLADDWADQRQVCIDVLCGYLRLPWEETATEGAAGAEELVVRQAVIQQIEAHITTDDDRIAENPWWDNAFIFTGARLPELRLRQARVRALGLSECRVDTVLNLTDFEVSEVINMRRATVSGSVYIEAKGAGVVNLGDARLTDGGSLSIRHDASSEATGNPQLVRAANVTVGAGSSATFIVLPQHWRRFFDVRNLRISTGGKVFFATLKDASGRSLAGPYRADVANLSAASEGTLHIDSELRTSVKRPPTPVRGGGRPTK